MPVYSIWLGPLGSISGTSEYTNMVIAKGRENGNEESAFLRPAKKRCRNAARKKSLLKLCVKNRHSLSPLALDKETETGIQVKYQRLRACQTYCNRNPRPASSPILSSRENTLSIDDALKRANEWSRRPPLSRTAVICKQQISE